MKLLILTEVFAVIVAGMVYLASSVSDDWLPILALTAAFTSPLLLAWLNGRQRSADKKEDWRREDQVAAAKKEADKVLIKTTKEHGAKLDQIHTLVNSNMTIALENELKAYRSNLVLLQAEAYRQERDGIPTFIEAHAAAQEMKANIGELETQLQDRREVTARAQMQLETRLIKEQQNA